ncbi:unnamed protein product [Linum trigynum]|uniref:Pulmonary surfactant-associated protein B n=1 Tax=Linum trigynum TaxID=586398 RepID=A0AAV2DXZ3_9ROSI
MDRRVELFFLLVLVGAWGCSARQFITLELPVDKEASVEIQKQGSGIHAADVAKKDQVCTICEQYSAQALEYISNNKTQTEIIGLLHQTCARFPPYKTECISLVDYYAPLFFLEVSSISPEDFCRKVDLCQKVAAIAAKIEEDACGICHNTVSEVMAKLKDPETQLEIIELLLKACNSMDSRKAQCKKLVFEYGPVILINAEQFLEKTDICTVLHACTNQPSSVVVADS